MVPGIVDSRQVRPWILKFYVPMVVFQQQTNKDVFLKKNLGGPGPVRSPGDVVERRRARGGSCGGVLTSFTDQFDEFLRPAGALHFLA